MYKQTNTMCKLKRIRIFALVKKCSIIMKTKSRFTRNVYAISDRIWVRSRNWGCLVTWFCYQLIAKPGNKTAAVSWPDPYDVTNISGTQPRKNMIMGKVDTSDLMMIITWAMDISFQSPKLKWASWTHTIPYMYIVIRMKGNREDWQHVKHTSTR